MGTCAANGQGSASRSSGSVVGHDGTGGNGSITSCQCSCKSSAARSSGLLVGMDNTGGGNSGGIRSGSGTGSNGSGTCSTGSGSSNGSNGITGSAAIAAAPRERGGARRSD